MAVCDSDANQLCLQVKNLNDIERRLQSVYVRFGWSITQQNQKIGVAPYCFEILEQKEKMILSGKLTPTKDNLPTIIFKVSNGENERFDLSLYGNDKLLNKTNARKLVSHTPSAFYLVRNPTPQKIKYPWEDRKSIAIISSFLKKGQLMTSAGNEFNHLLPPGEELFDQNSENKTGVGVLLIPDFIPHCKDLAQALEKEWHTYHNNSVAECEDIARFIPDRVLKDDGKWDAFIAPLTPGGFFKNALLNQYFSPSSHESWIKKTNSPEQYFYRIGLAQTYLVSTSDICSITPNPMGLSDILITDLKYCD